MALDRNTSVASPRRDPLSNIVEPRMGRLALVPLAAIALFVGMGLLTQQRVEARRMDAVAAAVTAKGHAGPVLVEPLRGEACWRAREGFSWKATNAESWACAGPRAEVRLQTEMAVQPERR